MFSCKTCEIFKNTVFHRTPPVAAFGITNTDEYLQAVKTRWLVSVFLKNRERFPIVGKVHW